MHLIGCSAGPRPVAQIEIVLWRASVNQIVNQRCHGVAGDQLQSCRAHPLQGTLQCRAVNKPRRSSRALPVIVRVRIQLYSLLQCPLQQQTAVSTVPTPGDREIIIPKVCADWRHLLLLVRDTHIFT